MPPAPGTQVPPLYRSDVRSSELPAVLAAYAPHIKVLSVDCFDTLLFRDTHQPIDVFFDLQNDPAFRAVGLSAQRRIDAESEARKYQFLRRGLTEVTLAQIHSPESLRLPATPEQCAALIEAELRAEERACAAFPPMLEVIRAAHAQGLSIIVVSDTYLQEHQLRRLLQSALPQDLFAMLSHVFCSNEFGRSKSAGMFELVLQKLERNAGEVLHIGDNTVADYFAPRHIGIHAAHLVHHDQVTEQILRMQTAAYTLQHTNARHIESIPSPFRAMLASVTRPDTPENALGYASLGPLLYSFSCFVLDELAALRAQGKKVKPLFLLRDGYLPQQVCNALAGAEVGAPVALSRFVSQAAAFRSKADVEEYFSRFIVSEEMFEPVSKQLLLPPEWAEKIARKCKGTARPGYEYMQQVLQPQVLRQIFERSRSYRQRVYQHLKARANIERGDTLVFIDLGYAGTGQRLLGPLLREDWDIEVIGRYMMVTPVPEWEKARKGLIDPSTCDNREIFALVPSVCIIEDLCTTNLPSATDFDARGEPVEGTSAPESPQFEKLRQIQAACIEFARDAQGYFEKAGRSPSTQALKATGLGGLTRLLFFPGEREISCLEGFQFDLNLATNQSFRLFDRAQGLLGLQRRGLPAMEKHEQFRTNFPVEMRAAHLSLAITLLTADRHSVSFNRADLTLRREKVPVIFLRGKDAATVPTDAIATYDGYYALIVPLGDGSFRAGINFGQPYQWLQIESIQAIPNQFLFSQFESRHAVDVRSLAKFEQMIERGPGLFECASTDSFLMPLPPAQAVPGQQLACRIIYRPLAARAKPVDGKP